MSSLHKCLILPVCESSINIMPVHIIIRIFHGYRFINVRTNFFNFWFATSGKLNLLIINNFVKPFLYKVDKNYNSVFTY